MKKLFIKNFGPIKNGFTGSEDGFFDISKLSVFVGEQGTGKSTVAKIISLFSWIEKKYQNKVEAVIQLSEPVFKEQFLKYHRIDSYLTPETQIKYIHDDFSIIYEKQNLRIQNNSSKYIRPKVLYVPAERSFCTAIINPYKVSGMPSSVLDFLSDYYDAEKEQQGKKVLLPVNGFEFRFSENENIAYISDTNKKYEIKIEDSSSGLQSLVPMYLTVNYCLNKINSSIDKRQNELNVFQTVELKKILEDTSLEKEKKNEELKKIFNSYLICVIEEPEQNLFPISQYDVIMRLLSGFSNLTDNNLIITTHSPYVLETINNCIYADTLNKQKIETQKIIPLNSQISYENVSAYLIQNGEIFSIKEDDLKQINPGSIDQCSKKITDIYSELAKLEYGE